jgi:hypothetical protein
VTADGAGDSLQRTSADAFGNLAENWIAALPSPGRVDFAPLPSGDLDGDGDVDADDIDALFNAIDSGLADDVYDLDRSGAVDDDDVTYLVEAIIGTIRGDANLDYRVDAADLNAVAIQWRDTGTSWASGDFTGDGNTDTADLNVLALNWRKGAVAAAAVADRIPRAPLAASVHPPIMVLTESARQEIGASLALRPSVDLHSPGSDFVRRRVKTRQLARHDWSNRQYYRSIGHADQEEVKDRWRTIDALFSGLNDHRF